MQEYKLDSNGELGRQLIKRFESLRSTRQNYERVLKEIDKYIYNKPSAFSTTITEGRIDGEDLYDTTGIISNSMLASILHSGLTSTAKKWVDLAPKDAKLKNIDSVKRWIDAVVDTMLSVFNSSESNFPQQNHEVLNSTTGYGTGCLYIDMKDGESIHFSARDLAEIYIMEDSNGVVDTVFREFELTARQAVQQFGAEGVSEMVRKTEQMNPDKKYKFIHACIPLQDSVNIYKDKTATPDIFSYIAYTVCCDDKKVCERKGYTGLPYIISRFEKLSGEVYGRSPAWKCLPDLKTLNKIGESELKALELAIEPIWGVPDDGVITEFNFTPNGVISGAVNEDGRQLLVPLNLGVKPSITDFKVQRLQESVRRAYTVHEYFQKEGTPLSATEINKKIQDSQILGAPNQFRIRSEYLSKVIARVLRLLLDNGKLPPIPQELIDKSGNFEYDIEYISPFTRQQRFDELDSINRAVQASAPLLQANPAALDVLDIDKWFRLSLDISGAPLSVIREYDDKKSQSLEEYRQQKAEEQQQMMQMQAEMDAQSKGIPPQQ
jgi:hypothetical protein